MMARTTNALQAEAGYIDARPHLPFEETSCTTRPDHTLGSVGAERATSQPSLVHDRAPYPMKLHHHSGSLFFPLREGRPVQMHFECGGVPVHFVRANFCIVVFRQ